MAVIAECCHRVADRARRVAPDWYDSGPVRGGWRAARRRRTQRPAVTGTAGTARGASRPAHCAQGTPRFAASATPLDRIRT